MAGQLQLQGQRVGRVVVVVGDEDAARGADRHRLVARGVGSPRRRRVARSSGSRTVNSVPRPGPSLCAPTRAAVHLDEPAHQRQADAQAALAAIRLAMAPG